MSDKNKIQNVALAESQALTCETEDGTDHAGLGKIARLPFAIREKVNRRLRNNQNLDKIASWLNGLPTVKKIMGIQFDGKPISHQNLSRWRQKGYKQWLERQEDLDELQLLADDAREFSAKGGGRLARGAATMISACAIKMFQHLRQEDCTPENIAKICYAVTALAQIEQSEVRLEHDKKRLGLSDEQLTLNVDKHQRDVVEISRRVLQDDQFRAIENGPYSNFEKIEMIGRRHFGKSWKPREIPKDDPSS